MRVRAVILKTCTWPIFQIALSLDLLQGEESKDKIESVKDVLEQLRKTTGLLTLLKKKKNPSFLFLFI